MKPMQAALKGAAEIGFTVLSISLSLVAVFIPILMMGGIIGRLFREFAVTISVAIGVSLCVSLTTTPMMCAWLLKAKADHAKHGPIYGFFESLFDWVLARYESSLQWVLRHQFTMIIATLLTIAFTGWLYVVVPKGFFPQQDAGRLTGTIMADQDTSFQQMNKLMTLFTTEVSHDPDVENLISFTGGGGGGGGRTVNQGSMYVSLKSIESAPTPRGLPVRSSPAAILRRTSSSSGCETCSCPHTIRARMKSSAGCGPSFRPFRGRRSTCSPTRTCGSAPARAARNINTPCRTTT